LNTQVENTNGQGGLFENTRRGRVIGNTNLKRVRDVEKTARKRKEGVFAAFWGRVIEQYISWKGLEQWFEKKIQTPTYGSST